MTKIQLKHLVSVCLLATAALTANAEEADTLMSRHLNEIVVKAPKVVRKSDMDVYYPSRHAVDNSKNGVQLLNGLMIPSLTVIDALGRIEAAGQPVQLRINGRETSIDQVRALQPETIKRIEWIDNPGLRYKDANYVLNFVVANPATGGSLLGETEPGLNVPWGFTWTNLKLNNGRSQWSVGANFKLTNKVKSHREYNETFTYPDGTSLTRDETSRGGYISNTDGQVWASYNYVKPDTTVLYVGVKAYKTFRNNTKFDGLMTLSDGSDDILLSDFSGSNGTTPVVLAYLEHHLDKSQTLVVDFQGSLYMGRSYSDYKEQIYGNEQYITDISTNIKDHNLAFAIEADYIKSWKRSRLTAGIRYNANRNRSQYENLGGEIFHQRQDKVYFYAEYFQRINKVSVTAGFGAQYTDFMFRENHQGNSSWDMRPQATLTYIPTQRHQFRLSFESWQSTPSLMQTNIAPQQIDGFQWRIGNPHLKTSNSYNLAFRYSFNLPRLNGSLGLRAFSNPNAIAPMLYWDENHLITTYENSRGLRSITVFLSPQIEIIPYWFMAGGYLQYKIEHMRGTGYKLHNYNWSGNANVRLTHWGYTLSYMYILASHDLLGEKIAWNESLSIIDLSYNWRSWQFSTGLIMPWGKYDMGSTMLSKWNSNEQHMRLDMRIPYVKVSYNLKWGRQRQDAHKLINAEAEVDVSKAGGR